MEDVQETIKALELFVTGIKRAKESGYRVAAAAIPGNETAIWALKKQAPEKPVLGMYGKHAVWACPSCGAYMLNPEKTKIAEYKHCPECGQKINWEARYDG